MSRARPPSGEQTSHSAVRGVEDQTVPDASRTSLQLRGLASLLVYKDPEALANKALALVMQEFGAQASSLLHVPQPIVQLRRGNLTRELFAHLDHWESTIQQRITASTWRVQRDQPLPLATVPVPETNMVALSSLVLNDNQVVGSLAVVFAKDAQPTGAGRRELEDYLRVVGNALCMAAEAHLVKNRLSQLSLFYQVAQSTGSTFDLNKVLNDTMQLASAVLDASVSTLMLVDEKTNELVFEYAQGDMSNVLRKHRTPIDEGIAGWVAANGVPVVINDVRQDPRYHPAVDKRTGFLTQSVVCVPLELHGKVIGVLEAMNKRTGQGFDTEDLRLMSNTANQAVIAIERSRLYQSLRDERDRIIQAQEAVRHQVARNLHDGTVQYLSAIAMGIDHLERLLGFDIEAARTELESIRELTRQATRQARLVLFELRPIILETQGLVPALQSYVQQLEGNQLFGLHLEAPDVLSPMENSVASTIFAVVQEAVTNAKKHAEARDVWLRLSEIDDRLTVVVEDNGKGFDLEAVKRDYDRTGSIGLLSMNERAQLIEGELDITTTTQPPRTGTRVQLRVPLHHDSD